LQGPPRRAHALDAHVTDDAGPRSAGARLPARARERRSGPAGVGCAVGRGFTGRAEGGGRRWPLTRVGRGALEAAACTLGVSARTVSLWRRARLLRGTWDARCCSRRRCSAAVCPLTDEARRKWPTEAPREPRRERHRG